MLSSDTEPTHLLRFWTSSAFIAVTRRGSETEARFNNERLDLQGADGARIGSIYLDRDWRDPLPDKLEFIVISRDIGPKNPRYSPDWTSGLNIMLIERQGTDIAQRVQVPTTSIAEEQWIKFDRTWSVVTLE